MSKNVVCRCIQVPNLVVSQMASFLLYLSDVEEGGETMFPFEVRSLFVTDIFTKAVLLLSH